MNNRLLLLLMLLSCSVYADPLHLTTQEKTYTFDVEIANTPETAQKGLMYRTYIPDFTGMLFTDTLDKTWYMWMKNTPTSLDMIFFNRQGNIVKIIQHTQPYSLSILSSDKPVAGVLEVVAGTVQKLNITIGDKLTIPHLTPQKD